MPAIKAASNKNSLTLVNNQTKDNLRIVGFFAVYKTNGEAGKRQIGYELWEKEGSEPFMEVLSGFFETISITWNVTAWTTGSVSNVTGTNVFIPLMDLWLPPEYGCKLIVIGKKGTDEIPKVKWVVEE